MGGLINARYADNGPVMAAHDQVYRFAAGGPDAPRSAVYRVWAPKPDSGKGDVYFALRRMGEEFKISLHAPRHELKARGHIAVSRETQNKVGLDERFLHLWERPDPSLDNPPDFELFLLGSELREEPPIEDDFTDVCWLNPPPDAGGLVVSVMVTASDDVATWEELLGHHSQLLTHFRLGDGSSCLVASQVVPELPTDFRAMVNRAKARMRSSQLEFTVGAPSLDDPILRAIVGAERNAGGPVTAWIEVDLSRSPEAGAA